MPILAGVLKHKWLKRHASIGVLVKIIEILKVVIPASPFGDLHRKTGTQSAVYSKPTNGLGPASAGVTNLFDVSSDLKRNISFRTFSMSKSKTIKEEKS
jgi:hypothetical protein